MAGSRLSTPGVQPSLPSLRRSSTHRPKTTPLLVPSPLPSISNGSVGKLDAATPPEFTHGNSNNGIGARSYVSSSLVSTRSTKGTKGTKRTTTTTTTNRSKRPSSNTEERDGWNTGDTKVDFDNNATQTQQGSWIFGTLTDAYSEQILVLMELRRVYATQIRLALDYASRQGLFASYMLLVENGGVLKWAKLSIAYGNDSGIVMQPYASDCRLPVFGPSGWFEYRTTTVEIRLCTNEYKRIGSTSFYAYDPTVTSPILYYHCVATDVDCPMTTAFASSTGVQLTQDETNVIHRVVFTTTFVSAIPTWPEILLSHIQYETKRHIESFLLLRQNLKAQEHRVLEMLQCDRLEQIESRSVVESIPSAVVDVGKSTKLLPGGGSVHVSDSLDRSETTEGGIDDETDDASHTSTTTANTNQQSGPGCVQLGGRKGEGGTPYIEMKQLSLKDAWKPRTSAADRLRERRALIADQRKDPADTRPLNHNKIKLTLEPHPPIVCHGRSVREIMGDLFNPQLIRDPLLCGLVDTCLSPEEVDDPELVGYCIHVPGALTTRNAITFFAPENYEYLMVSTTDNEYRRDMNPGITQGAVHLLVRYCSTDKRARYDDDDDDVDNGLVNTDRRPTQYTFAIRPDGGKYQRMNDDMCRVLIDQPILARSRLLDLEVSGDGTKLTTENYFDHLAPRFVRFDVTMPPPSGRVVTRWVPFLSKFTRFDRCPTIVDTDDNADVCANVDPIEKVYPEKFPSQTSTTMDVEEDNNAK